MLYGLTHALSYYIRNSLFSFPVINIFNLDPQITEFFILNGLIGCVAFILAGIHYDKNRHHSSFGSFLYLLEYTFTLALIWITIPITRFFGLSDIYSLTIPILLMLTLNMKIASII